MKYFFASDIHGDRAAAEAVVAAYRASGAARLCLLGDILYHGPRNDLPAAYDPKGVIALLNGISGEILAVRGNCDSPTSPYGCVREEEMTVSFCGRRLLLLHGHTASAKSGMGGLVALARRHNADVVLFGHTHTPADVYLPEAEGGPLWLLNPGSLGHPGDGVPSFGRLVLGDDGQILFSVGKQGVRA